jgi:predicted DNA-binding transcriptional regulator AlpA
MSETEQLMTIQDVAEYLKVSRATLYSWRCKNENTGPTRGPRSIKLGRHVRYRRSDVDVWLQEKEETDVGSVETIETV